MAGKGRIIGVVGGMGPESGLALCNAILRHTHAKVDQQHLPCIMMSFPGDIEDRTAYLQGTSAINPALGISKVIEKLERTGAAVIGIACNTCHSPAIYDVLVERLHKINSVAHLLSMPHETCRYIAEKFPLRTRVGILSTNGTYKSGLYKNLLENCGYEVVIPSMKFQDEVIHRMIYDPEFGIKSSPNNIRPEVMFLLEKALKFFSKNGADVIVVGCTELSLVIKEVNVKDMFVADSIEALAKALIREATASEMISPRLQHYHRHPIIPIIKLST